MFFPSLLAISAIPLLVSAQDYGGGGAASKTTAAASAPTAPADTATQKNVNVAFNGLVFSPTNVVATNGTNVTFYFPNSPVPHSVTQSTFANPCTYLAPANGSTGGFDSGLVTAKQFTITVTDDSRPIWFHCKVQGHCGSGMVGSINAPSTGNTFSSFETAAKALGSNAPQAASDEGFKAGGIGATATAPTAAKAQNGAPKLLASAGVAILSATVLSLLL